MDEKIDARKLTAKVIEEKRREAHRLRKRGMTRAEIGEILEIRQARSQTGQWPALGGGARASKR